VIACRFSARARRLALIEVIWLLLGKNRYAVVKPLIAAWRDSSHLALRLLARARNW